MSCLRAPSFAVPLAAATLLSLGLPAQWAGEYPLDQSGGTTAIDISGGGNDGTLISFGSSPWVTGQFGNALDFAPGVDDYVELSAANPQLPLYDGRGTPYSIAYWIKAPNVGAVQGQNVFTQASDNTFGNRALFMLHGGGSTGDRVRLLIRTSVPNNVLIAESTAAVYDDTWHHVAVTEASGEISFYVDGVLDSTHSYIAGREPGTPGFTSFIFDRYSVGAVVRPTGIIDELGGQLDDMRLYKYELSAADVAQVAAGVPLLPTRSSIAEYGVGCGAGPFDLAVSGSASLGGPGVQLQMQNGTPNTIAFLLFGAGQVDLFDLGLIGFPNCTAYPTNFEANVTGVVDASGAFGPLSIGIPNDPNLASSQFVVQGAALEIVGFTAEFTDAGILMLGL
ncbi:MAG: LamG domain-containing protein [Planctomycetota bacterium]